MKPFRAAALLAIALSAANPAFAGWYFMAPPRTSATVDINVPLGRWEVWGSYDQSIDCEHWLNKDIEEAIAQLTNPELAERDRRDYPNLTRDEHLAIEWQAAHAKCIATDDPRLAR
jgi:hypothetical protein